MSAYNSERKRCSNIIELEFKEVAKLPPSFSLNDRKKFTKKLITVLRDMSHPINKTNGMADILLIIPQGAYDRKVPKVE